MLKSLPRAIPICSACHATKSLLHRRSLYSSRIPASPLPFRTVSCTRNGPLHAQRTDTEVSTSHSEQEEAHIQEHQGEVVDAVLEQEEKKKQWNLTSWAPPSLMAGAFAASAGLFGVVPNLDGPGSTVKAVAVLASIIAVHELGHFIAARSQNIHVNAFSIGFGPALLSYQGKEVEYSLRAIPLGGYVGFPDDDPESKFAQDDPDLLKNRPIIDRAIVLSAGVIANVLFAFAVLFTQVSTVGVTTSNMLPGVKVQTITAQSAGARGGLQAGDVIVGIDGISVGSSIVSVPRVVDSIKASAEKRVLLTVDRAGNQIVFPVFPALGADGEGRLGVQLSGNATIRHRVARGPIEAASMAGREFTRLFNSVTKGLSQLFFNFSNTASQISGPVAIIVAGAEVSRADISGLFQFCAILNINLAVVNILPLPALDGGFLALLAVEAARGKKLPKEVEQGIMASGVLLLTCVGFFLLVKDTLGLTSLL